jgi:hypothetical protein
MKVTAEGVGATAVETGRARLASEADARGAQLALAIEAISDDVEKVLGELADLRAAVDEERSVLDELAADPPS